MTDRINAILLTILVAGLCLVAVAHGQTEDVTTPPASVEPAPAPGDVGPPTELATADVPGPVAPTPEVSGIVSAMQSGHWLVALGGLVLVLVAGARWALKPKGRLAKLVLAGAIAALTTLGVSWQAGAGWSWALVGTALAAAWTSAGMYDHGRDAMERAPR